MPIFNFRQLQYWRYSAFIKKNKKLYSDDQEQKSEILLLQTKDG